MDDEELAKIREKKLQELRGRLDAAKKPVSVPVHAAVMPVSELQFPQVVRDYPFVVIDFWAEWCGPCKRVAPVVAELAQEFAGKVAFCKCNTDENQRLALQFGISAIPTLLFFSHGQMVDRIIGAYPKETIRIKVQRAFGV